MKNFFKSIKIFFMLTVICGVVYPLLIFALSQFAFSEKANGSLIIKDKRLIGSNLIGQQFIKPEFFWGRPSAINNNPMPSGGSNLNPIGEKLKNQIQIRMDSIRKYHGNLTIIQIPKELLFASASGVDPHISPETAYFQVQRIAKFRNFDENQILKLKQLINSSIENRDLFIFGEPRVNLMNLNLQLLEL